jgi:hypothetical protein
MDARVLQRLRRKVGRGERLSEAELQRLRTAADIEGGATLGITLGLALSNAGADAEALSVLGALGESTDLAHARARALVWAERTAEAERVLAEAVFAHPRDVELRKSLAVLALRRGDRSAAERWLLDARSLAPEDQETRDLLEGLTAAETAGSTLEVLLEGRHRGAWTRFWPLTTREHGGLRATWTDSEADPSEQEILSQVVPLLAATAGAEMLAREGPAGLVIGYAADGVPLRVHRERSQPRRLETLDAVAWRNLESRSGQPRAVIVDRGRPRLSPEPLGLWALCEADGSDGARLLTRSQRDRLFQDLGPGPYRVSLVRRELALVAPLLDPAAVSSLDSLEPGPDGIPGRFVLMADGSLQRTAG